MDAAALAHARQWIGRSDVARDVLSERLAESYAATFAPHGAGLDGVHWCLAPEIAPTPALGGDGHPPRGGTMPPAPLPRRMWASGETTFVDALRIGDAVTRTMTVADVTLKEGASGPLLFVACDYVFETARGPAIRERRTIVYRGAEGAAAAAQPAPAPAELEWRVETSPALLLRYSALTFNAHRIHYDRDYAMGEEGYGGLVVHGPLQASYALAAAAALMGSRPARVRYRAVAPLIAGGVMAVCARRQNENAATAWTGDGGVTFTAEAAWDG